MLSGGEEGTMKPIEESEKLAIVVLVGGVVNGMVPTAHDRLGVSN